MQSNDICQRLIPRGRNTKEPLGDMPTTETPFDRVVIDMVGPLVTSARKHRWVLTMVHYATRYPEAVPLTSIETTDVVEALVNIFSRVGIHRQIISDRGSQFTSGLMKEVARLLSIKQLTTTTYHGMCNGLVEKFNGTLKNMLKRMAHERPTNWDRYIPALLFVYREIPQESLKFSPFELLYGRTVRGPMSILRELWADKVDDDETKTTYHCVMELRERLEETRRLAHEELRTAKVTQRDYYNKMAKPKVLKVGDKVLILLPTDNNKLLLQWKGPHDIVATVGVNDYRLQIGEGVKTFYANMLRKYIARGEQGADQKETDQKAMQTMQMISEDDDSQLGSEDGVVCPLEANETWKDVYVCPSLTEVQKTEARQLIEEYKDVFSDMPGHADLIECTIELVDDTPIRCRNYPVPFALEQLMKEELEKMDRIGGTDPSTSDYASSSVIVRKSDGSHRYCIDFRKLNEVILTDAEPMSNQEMIVGTLGTSKYFTKIES